MIVSLKSRNCKENRSSPEIDKVENYTKTVSF